MPIHIKPKPRKMQTFYALRDDDGKYAMFNETLDAFTNQKRARYYVGWWKRQDGKVYEVVKIIPKEVK
jgi:hypothetical protein